MAVAWPVNSIGYDIETFPNCFLFTWAWLSNPDACMTFEISDRRDDRQALYQFFEWCRLNGIELVGFNNVGFDYPVCHFIYHNIWTVTADSIYQKAMSIINADERFGNIIWENKRFATQIDLYLIHHFDNIAKTQSLKGLEFNMRSPSVQDMPVQAGTYLTSPQVDELIKYNWHDVRETIRFAHISSDNVRFRRELKGQLDGDVLNFNDTKIGKQTFEQKLGDELCYDRSTGRKVPRQTYREKIVVADILFPYITFEHPEFQKAHDYFRNLIITKTKGAFSLAVTINGFTFHFGLGGIHGSVDRKAVRADELFTIWDIDVAALYPSIGIVNNLYPAHLGPRFTEVWAEIVAERKKYAKGTSENAARKLAANGPYGDSNNDYSPLKDPQFTMTITINGQLLLCKLAEQLMKIPTLELIQINTDGITFKVYRGFEAQVSKVMKDWENWSRLVLEEARYSKMFIRDVNNYIAVTEPDKDGHTKAKLKGAYWYPVKFPDDISKASPSAWYKDLGAPIVQKAAEAAMLHGIAPEHYIAMHTDPFDFMLRAKVDRKSQLMIGDKPAQRITRYYVALDGAPMSKRSPPTGKEGAFKRKAKVDDGLYIAVMRELEAAGTPDAWDARIHTGNKSVYAERQIGFVTGWNVEECNVAANFRWTNLNRQWYIDEAKKLIIQ